MLTDLVWWLVISSVYMGVIKQNSLSDSQSLSSVNRDRQQYQFTRSTNSTNNFILPSKVPNKDGVGNSASLLTGEISSPAIKKPSIAAILQLLLKGSFPKILGLGFSSTVYNSRDSNIQKSWNEDFVFFVAEKPWKNFRILWKHTSSNYQFFIMEQRYYKKGIPIDCFIM